MGIHASNNSNACGNCGHDSSQPGGGSNFIGNFSTLADLQTLHPNPAPGSYAYITVANGPDIIYWWDSNDSIWRDLASDNIDIKKYFKLLGQMTHEQILARINTLPTYLVNDRQSVWFIGVEPATSLVEIIGEGQPLGYFAEPRVVKYKMMNKGKGTYGQTGTQLLRDDIELVYESVATPEDIATDPSTDTIQFGDIGVMPLNIWLNGQFPVIEIQSQDEGYTLFKGNTEGEQKSFLWLGVGGNFGLGNGQSTAADFQELNSAAVPITTPSWEQTLNINPESSVPATLRDTINNSLHTIHGKGLTFAKNNLTIRLEFPTPTANITIFVPAKAANDVMAMMSDVVLKLNKGANIEFEKLSDTSDVYGTAFFSRLGAMYRSPDVEYNQSLKQFTVKGTQAIWQAWMEVTDGNMGIKILNNAVEAFKLFDLTGNFMSFGTEAGKRITRTFTASRLVNGSSFNETEYKAIQGAGLVSTLIKAITVPINSILTIDVANISVMNIDKNYIIGRAQFSFRNNAGVITNISQNKLRYEEQYSSLTNAYVTGSDTRIDAVVSGTSANINFVNTIDKLTNVHCEVKYTVTLIPEL